MHNTIIRLLVIKYYWRTWKHSSNLSGLLFLFFFIPLSSIYSAEIINNARWKQPHFNYSSPLYLLKKLILAILPFRTIKQELLNSWIVTLQQIISSFQSAIQMPIQIFNTIFSITNILTPKLIRLSLFFLYF